MGLTRLAIKLAVPTPKIEFFERYLFIGPHPDDIEIGAGATAAKLAKEGKTVCFLICIDGRFGDGASGGIKGDALAALRKQEAIASAKMLGITDVRFLDLHDGAGYSIEELEKGIAAVVGDFKPDLIFAPDPDVTSECHADHRNTGAAARKIACFAPYPGIMETFGAASADVQALAYYITAKPNRFVKTPGLLPLQYASIFDCHKSQYPEGSAEAASIRLYLKLRSVEYGIRTFSTGAEGFRVLGKTHMHFLPEAGQ